MPPAPWMKASSKPRMVRAVERAHRSGRAVQPPGAGTSVEGWQRYCYPLLVIRDVQVDRRIVHYRWPSNAPPLPAPEPDPESET